MTAKNAWYIKSRNKISGPYTTMLVSRRILLGRFGLHDEASIDNISWKPIRDIPELVPELLKKDQADPYVKERLAAARRWADERLGRDRRDVQDARLADQYAEQRAGRDRRQREDVEEIDHRLQRQQRVDDEDVEYHTSLRYEKKSYAVHSVILVLLVLGGAYAAYLFLPRFEETPVASCNSAPAPKVDWSNCTKPGFAADGVDLQEAVIKNANLTGSRLRNSVLVKADMSYAILSVSDLQGADLTMSILLGANLQNTNLANANFTGSNLSYANLSGANLAGVNLQNAILDKAIWIDGRECLAGSLGECK